MEYLSLMTFKFDTGAEVTVIQESAATPFKELLRLPEGRLHGPAKSSLSVCGQFTGTLQLKSKTVKEEIFVVKNLHKPLVGFPAIPALNLLMEVKQSFHDFLSYLQAWDDSKGNMKSN